MPARRWPGSARRGRRGWRWPWPGRRPISGSPRLSATSRSSTSRIRFGDGGAGLDADLATAGIRISPPLRLRHAARLMGAGGHGRQPGWLEVVLFWPHRIIKPGPDVRHTATGQPATR